MESYLQYRKFGRRAKSQINDRRQDRAALNPSEESPALDLETLNEDNPFSHGSPSTQTGSLECVEDFASPRLEFNQLVLDNVQTNYTIGTRLGMSLTGIDVRSRNTHQGKELGRVFIVGFEGSNDPMDPHNWSISKRSFATFNIGMIAWAVGMAASVDSLAIPQASAEFGVSAVTEALATGLFLVGFGCGALIAGPLSEIVGRNPVYIGFLVIYILFIMGAGLSQNIGAQLVCRFLAGFAGEAPLSTVGGSLGDMWNPMQLLIAFPAFATLGFVGPMVGPILGGFIAESKVISWRWTEWVTMIMSGLVLVSMLLFQPETYKPVLLRWKASHLRQLTADNRYLSASEILDRPFSSRMIHALSRPFIMIVQEPTILLWTGYLTVIYMILFGFLAGYSFIFGNTYHMSQGITGLMFVGITIGLCLCSILLTPLIYHWAKQDLNALRKDNPDEVQVRLPPECRLWQAMLGAPAIPIALFWMGWTANPEISFWSPLIASVFFGYGVLCVFISTSQYLIDIYEVYAASALTMITLVRYVAAGGMVEVMIPMYNNLGVHFTLTILACIAVAFTPVPYLFYRFGPWIRSKSRFAARDNLRKLRGHGDE